MRIYVSSTFEDLKLYRAACIRVLRQLGHEVVSMEDYVSESSIPVDKVVKDVRSCDLFVILVAWRYGFVPDKSRISVDVSGAIKGETSITHYEYLAAKESDATKTLAFLVHERAPWPPHLMDGFETSNNSTSEPSLVLGFRNELQTDQIVAFFEQPADLEARLSAAVTSVGLRKQLLNNSVSIHKEGFGVFAGQHEIGDSGLMPLRDLVFANPSPSVVQIDIGTIWWSTRFYLLALVADLLTEIERIIVMKGSQFVGMASPNHVRTLLQFVHPELKRFERKYLPQSFSMQPHEALEEILSEWRSNLGEVGVGFERERSIQVQVAQSSLCKWLGDGFLTGGIVVENPNEATAIDLLRILDYPNDYVPMIAESDSASENLEIPEVSVINKASLNAQLAKNHIDDMLTSLGLRKRN